VTTWGLPRNWKPAKYIVEKYGTNTNCVESRTTLKPLIKALEPDMILIFVPDTVYIETLERNRAERYEDICKIVQQYYIDFCKENDIDINKIIVEVCPAVGRFQKRVEDSLLRLEAVGSAYDYYVNLYWRLIKFLYDLGKKSINVFDKNIDIEFIIDLSHGVNYMPVLVYRAVREVCQLLAIFRSGRVKLLAYNSDPVIEEGQHATIHLIEEVDNVRPYIPSLILKDENGLSRLLSGTRQLENSDEYSRVCKDIYERLKKTFEEYNKRIRQTLDIETINVVKVINMLIGAFYHGLPLIISRYYIDSEILLDLVTEVFNIWRENIKVKYSEQDKTIRIIRYARFSLNKMEIVLRALFLVSGIEALHLRPRIRGALSIDELESYDRYIISNLNPFLGAEYGRLFESKESKNVLRKIVESRGTLRLVLARILLEREKKAHDRCEETVDENKILERCDSDVNACRESKNLSNVCRNFIAHAGLEWCLVDMFSRDGQVFLRYVDDSLRCLYDCCTYMLKEV